MLSTLGTGFTLAWLSDVAPGGDNFPRANKPFKKVSKANHRDKRMRPGRGLVRAGGQAHLPELLLHLPVDGVGANPPPGLGCSLHWLLRDLVPLEVHKDSVVKAPGPAQADEVFAWGGGVVVAFPGDREAMRPGAPRVAQV